MEYAVFTFVYLLFSSLNLRMIQCHTNSVSSGLCRKVALEFGTNHVTVSMGPSHLSLDYSGLVWFASSSHCVLCLYV